jgi:hypothetical protein
MSIDSYGKSHGLDLSEIVNAKSISNDNITKIRDAVFVEGISPFGNDMDLVVFGSIARAECTNKSDIDWTLLVDGQANPQHDFIGRRVRGNIRTTGLSDPGLSGMFGQISFSHELIHCIGGEDDTNHNLSRRLLLLLESERIAIDNSEDSSGTAYSRVIGGILDRYLTHDSAFHSDHGKEDNVPRFLVNDIVRFWRTMCVDFAYKQIEQSGKKWALRNIKLRMSRKAIFLKGMLMCAAFYKKPIPRPEMQARMMEIVSMKSLDFILQELISYKIKDDLIIQLLESYNAFLGMLNNETLREKIAEIPMESVYKDKDFLTVRENANKFQEALTEICLKQDTFLKDFSFKYAFF